MSRKSRRKPVIKTMAAATEELQWRAKVLAEIIEGLQMPPQVEEPLRRMLWALDDYEASKAVPFPPEGAITRMVVNGGLFPDPTATLVIKP